MDLVYGFIGAIVLFLKSKDLYTEQNLLSGNVSVVAKKSTISNGVISFSLLDEILLERSFHNSDLLTKLINFLTREVNKQNKRYIYSILFT